MTKRIYRSSDAMLGGVCAGIGEFLDADPTLIRLVWALSFLLGGIGFFGYLIAWFIIPKKPLE